MSKRLSSLIPILLAVVLALGSLTLVGCGGSSDDSSKADANTTEQDNCYGDDMPVINE
ncbi:MAG: hypothetical protein Q4A01_02385 [Coriobacteriales bacterium]|nr:hypothetical protein [Coriobacteriales bacterium]